VKTEIRLTRHNKALLKQLVKTLFATFKVVRMRGKGVVLKKRWYSTKKTIIPVAELVLLKLPFALNDLYKEAGYDQLYPHFSEMYDSLDYFQSTIEDEDIISHLYYKFNELSMSNLLSDEYEEEPLVLKARAEVVVEGSRAIEQTFTASVKYFVKKSVELLERFEHNIKVIHINTSSACHSPPIRAMPILLKAI